MTQLSCQCSKQLKAAVVREARKMGATESHLIRYGLAMFLHSMGALKDPPNPIMLHPSGRRKKIKRTPVKFARRIRKVEKIVCEDCGSIFPVRYHADIGIDQDICPGCGKVHKAA